jgi:predicted Zn-dependent protease
VTTVALRWPGTRFDGRSAAGEIVTVSLDGTALRIVSRTRLDRVPLDEVRVAETFSHAPAMIGLPGGATLELCDGDQTFGAAIEALGRRVSPVVRLQRHGPFALAALVALLALLAWAYQSGLPRAARALVSVLPMSVEQRLGERILPLIDQRLRRSTLPDEQRASLERAFKEAADKAAPGVAVRLEFRQGPPNALALPGGTIVITDSLVGLANSDDELLGALGHELGHVVHRHSMRQLAQALGVAAMASLLWGDPWNVAINVTTALGVFHYSREFGREADDHAIAFMHANGLSVRALDRIFARLEVERGRGALPDFLSTHPSTEERRQRFREAVRPDPAGGKAATR